MGTLNRIMKTVCGYGLLVLLVVLPSCGDNEGGGNGSLPEWDKSKTMHIAVAGKTDGSSLLASGEDDAGLLSLLRSRQSATLLLKDCEVSYGNITVNPFVSLAYELRRIPVFGKGMPVEGGYSGNGFLLDHTLAAQTEKEVSGNSNIKSVETFVTNNETLDAVLATLSVVNQEDVEQAAGALASLLRDGTLVVGFMQNSWLEEFKAAVAQRVDGCRLETVTAYADGVSLFVLSSDKWVLRESASEEEGAYMVSDLQVEQLY